MLSPKRSDLHFIKLDMDLILMEALLCYTLVANLPSLVGQATSVHGITMSNTKCLSKIHVM